MEIKLEINRSLERAIIYVANEGTSDPGSAVQKAFGIDFMKLIKEHTEGGDVRLEVKEALAPDYEKLKHALSPFVEIKLGKFSNGEIDTLITIAKGIYWRADLHKKISRFEKEIERELNK